MNSSPQRNTTGATFVPSDASGIQKAARSLREGGLVAFPTETVYGLGANAMDEQAVRKIFQFKGRPLTDPLIVHVPTIEAALKLVQLDEENKKLFQHLGNKFWPGPLTLIARASPSLPSCVSAETGFVGIRIPSLPLARTLLAEAKRPVAAPSANRFGHVSPTAANHVMADLGDHPIMILENVDEGGGAKSQACAVGIESTVAKLDHAAGKLVLFRRGGVSQLDLERSLFAAGFSHINVEVMNNQASSKVNQQAPGQLLTHYAPDIETLLVDHQCAIRPKMEMGATAKVFMERGVLLDFNGGLAALNEHVLAYKDLSPSGNVHEAAHVLFDSLRWAETVTEAKYVLISDISSHNHEHTAAVFDRMFRAASGKKIHLVEEEGVYVCNQEGSKISNDVVGAYEVTSSKLNRAKTDDDNENENK